MTSFRYRLVGYGDEVVAAYRALRPDQADAEGLRKLEWKFGPQPGGEGCALIAYDAEADAPMGMLAFQPARLATGRGERLDAYQAVDTIVAPAARGQGLFVKMGREFDAQGDRSLLYGFPNAAAAPGWYRHLGWQHFGQAPFLFRPLRARFLTRRLGLGMIDAPIPLRRARTQVRVFDRFADRHEAHWRAHQQTVPNRLGVDRSAAFLNHRFVDHPCATYDRIEAPDGTFLVSQLLDRHGSRILYVMEALGRSDSLADLLRHACRDARERGAEVALAWSMRDGDLGRAYRAARFFALPERLRPIEINFGARAEGLPSGMTRRDWILSYADSDTL